MAYVNDGRPRGDDSPDLNPIEPKGAESKSKRKKYRCDIDVLFQEYIT